MHSQYLKEQIELLFGICQRHKASGYCPKATGHEEDIFKVNLSNTGIIMFGDQREHRFIVKIVCENCLEGSVGHGMQEKLGLQEKY